MVDPKTPDDLDFARQFEAAVRAGREADRIEPRAHTVRYDPLQGLVLVELRSGFVFGFPPERVASLAQADAEQLSRIRISPSGDGLHWDELDAQLSLTGLISDALNLRDWAPRIMGQVRSEAKARAARKNGLKGGRPPKSSKPKTRSKKSV
jgi:hypothetical protein